MGCNSSKAISHSNIGDRSTNHEHLKQFDLLPDIANIKDKGQQLYKILSFAVDSDDQLVWKKVVAICTDDHTVATYRHPITLDSPLHLACRVVHTNASNAQITMRPTPEEAIHTLIQCCPDSVSQSDAYGYIPLHYLICSSLVKERVDASVKLTSRIVRLLIAANPEASSKYLSRNDVTVGEDQCTPLYHMVSSLPDDFDTPTGTTVELVRSLRTACPATVLSIRNKTDHDKPLALLYRRFSRQFDLSEKFFTGDNSRPEVLEYRKRYKAAAVNTWKIIITLLGPTHAKSEQQVLNGNKSVADFFIIHSAVQVDCPPDLLRYIIETRPEEVRQFDQLGRLPLHCAACTGGSQSFPAHHFKFIFDELLYAFPDGAACEDKEGKLPLELAIESGKTWIGGGVKSLNDVFPDAMTRISLSKYPVIQKAIGASHNLSEEGEGKEEHYDAIMLVQRKDADLGDVVSTMWSNEDDGGVQLLGCVAIYEISKKSHGNLKQILSIALTAVSAIVNAMKNHPNEPGIQEKACKALCVLACADNQREVNFTASAAVASIVSAMQAHVSDAIVQQEACTALREIVKFGGSDRATVIASVSGFTAIRNAMGAHTNTAGVQRESCLLLESLTSFSDASLPNLPTAQLAPLLESAAKKYPSDCKESVAKILPRLSNT